MEPTAHLYARGPYRVLVAPADPESGRPYVVTDTAGAWLRDEPSFDAARAWVDARVASDASPPAHRRPAPPRR